MIHCHGHSGFSALDGLGSPTHRAQVAARHGQAGLALTDHGTVGGLLAHRKACRENGIIPVAGVEAYFRPDRLTREKEWRYRRWHVILLAKNLVGWHNLIRITSASYGDGYYQSPCVDWDLFERYHEGLIMTTSCTLGPLSYLVQNGTDAQVDDWMQRAKNIFGDDLWVSIMPHDIPVQQIYNLEAVSIANKHGVGIVHEKDSHYPEKGWVETQKIAILTGLNKTFAEAEEDNRRRIEAGDEVYELWHDGLNISSEDEDRALYAANHPFLPSTIVDQAMDNTDEILRRIEPYQFDRSLKMPRVFSDVGAKAEVLRWCRQGLVEMGRDGDQVYEDRLAYEASVVDLIDAWSYFWVVGDVVRWCRSDEPLPATPEDPTPARKKPIRLNSGRGSAAASLICRASKITMIDPIAHRFKFERFMNPERRSMPDVDLDVASSRRPEVKEYMARRHGRDSIADLVAYQHFQPRASLKAVAKAVSGFGSDAYKRVSVLTHEKTGVIDPVHDFDLEKIRQREPALQAWADDFPDLWEHARRLENAGDPSVLRLSKHAAGVAVLPGRVTDVVPTLRSDEEEQTPRTAWAETTKISVTDETGIVKIDFLGLSGMDRQQMIMDMVLEHTGQVVDIDGLPALSDPYDVDDDVMDVFRQGLTLGVNQVSGFGITEFVRNVSPDNVVDLTAINALYRPGPLGSGGHNRFVKRRRGIDVPDYPPVVHEVIGDTALTICFQEQVMEFFEKLAGYTPGQADNVRKIIAKLYRDKTGSADVELGKLEEIFVPRATEVVGAELAHSLWEEILPYSGYCLTGDTVLIRGAAGRYASQNFTIRDMHDAWFSDTHVGKKYRYQGLTILAYEKDGRVRPARVKKVWSNGVKDVYEVITESGRKIKGTDNHRLLTARGYQEIKDIQVGDELVVMDRSADVKPVPAPAQHRGSGATYEGFGVPTGEENPSWVDGRSVALKAARVAVKVRADGKCENCGALDTGKKHSLEFAHTKPLVDLDDDYSRYHSADNARLLCNSCHKSFDYSKGERKKRFSKGIATSQDRVVEVRYAGREEVFDIEMASEEHNFIANEIVSHNSFNRPHAGSYMVQGYQDGWLKKRYPLFAYATYLTLDEDNTLAYLREARDPMFDLSVLPPDVNVSGDGFTPDVEVNAIRFGLRGIKGIGEAVAEQVVADRPYLTLQDFMERSSRKYSKVNKAARDVLLRVGALDSLGGRDHWDARERARAELELLGVSLEPSGILGEDAEYVSGHVDSGQEVADAEEGSEVVVAGKVVDYKVTKTKNGRNPGRLMATGIQVALDLEHYRCVAFPETWAQYEDLLTGDEMVIVKGRTDDRGGIKISAVMELETFIAERKEAQLVGG